MRPGSRPFGKLVPCYFRYLAMARIVLLPWRMSIARPVYREARLMITKRVHGRVFRLRPSKRVNEIVGYVVAVVAARTGIRLHCIVVMSNHWHVCLTDPGGRVCEFTRDCHAFIARAVNAAHGDFESLWSSEQTSHVACVEPSDLVLKMAYAMANPVEAKLVAHGKNWPGVRICWPARPRMVARPRGFFRDESEGGKWPAVACLEMSRPPGYEELTDDELEAMVRAAIDEREERFRLEARRDGKEFLGRRGVMAQSRHARPGRREPRFEMSPRVACRNKWRRIERLRRDRKWRAAYAQALQHWRNGEREVLFPHGTYQMRVLHGVTCVGPPA